MQKFGKMPDYNLTHNLVSTNKQAPPPQHQHTPTVCFVDTYLQHRSPCWISIRSIVLMVAAVTIVVVPIVVRTVA